MQCGCGGTVPIKPVVAEFREEIARLKEKACSANMELEMEREKTETATFGKEKLLSVNKKLLDQVKLLKEERLPETQSHKLFELQRKIEQQKELAEITFEKCVNGKGNQLKCLNVSDKNIAPTPSEDSIKFTATEKDSGLHMAKPDSTYDALDHPSKESPSDDSFLQLKIAALEIESKTMQDSIAKLQKTNIALNEKQTARKIAQNVVLKGMKKISEDGEEEIRGRMKDLEKKLTVSKEGCRMLQMHALNMAKKMKHLNKNYANAANALKIVNEELTHAKKIIADNEALKKRELDEVVAQLKKEEDALKKIIQNLKEELLVAKDDAEETQMKYFILENKISTLEKEKSEILRDLHQEKNLREEEAVLRGKLAGTITKLIAEKGLLILGNKNLAIKKNRLGLKNDRLKGRLEDQGRLLAKAQAHLRSLEEEKYQRRLRKSRGWRKFRFWK